jgi:hypothetical protein
MSNHLACTHLFVLVVLFLSGGSIVGKAQPMTFSEEGRGGNCGTCEWIQANGEITPDTPARFRDFAKNDVFPGEVILLNSPGGEPRAAAELGREFRKHNLYTQIGIGMRSSDTDSTPDMRRGRCVSACIFAFIGGSRRTLNETFIGEGIASNGGAYHFATHRFSSPGASVESAQKLASILSSYLSDMGVDPILLAVSAGTDDLREITPEEAANWRLTNDPRLPTRWQIDRSGNGIQASTFGESESEETNQIFTVIISMYCGDQTTGALYLVVRVRVYGESPLDNESAADFCGQYSIGIRTNKVDGGEDLASAKCRDTPGTYKGGFGLETSYNAANTLVVGIAINDVIVNLVNSPQDIYLAFHPQYQAALRSLAEYYLLPANGRQGLPALLRRSCVR